MFIFKRTLFKCNRAPARAMPGYEKSKTSVRISSILLILSGLLSMSTVAVANEDLLADLEAFTASIRAQAKPEIEPLPTIQPAESFEYAASETVNPFSEQNVIPKIKASLEIAPVLPDQGRVREPLEYFPLDSLRMSGTLLQEDVMIAVVFAPDQTVHMLRRGDYAGTQLGEVTEITLGEVILEETVKRRNGQWEKRKVSLALTE